MPRNVEVKIRVGDLEDLLRRVLALGAADAGSLHQVDTYFGTPAGRGGRLKLREQRPGGAQLIAYHRPDTAGLRTSDYRVAAVADPAALRDALAAALGVTGRIEKVRRLLLRGRTRIHLDRVEGLGSFLELEVVLGDGEATGSGEREAEQLLTDLGLEGAPRLPGSYRDELERAETRA
jgi:predicted adenylyl cyclase CyaB